MLDLYSNTFLIKIIIIMKLRRQKWHRRDNDKLDSSNIFIFFFMQGIWRVVMGGVFFWSTALWGPYKLWSNGKGDERTPTGTAKALSYSTVSIFKLPCVLLNLIFKNYFHKIVNSLEFANVYNRMPLGKMQVVR